MELKPGYKQTEVGVIPEDWWVCPIGDLVEKFRGGAPFKPSDFTDSGISVLPKGGVVRGGVLDIKENEKQFCSPDFADAHLNNQVDSTYTIVVLRDLVPSGPSIGLMVKIPTSQEIYVLAQGVYGFKVNEQVDAGYLIQLSNTSIYRKLVNSIMVGSTQVHITNTSFKLARISLPSTKTEQTAIANALSDADTLIQSLTRLIAKKRQIKQGAMQTLLNPYENGRLKDGWGFVTYGDAFNFLVTASFSRNELSSSGEYGYIHYGDIHTLWDGFVDFKKDFVPAISQTKAKNYVVVNDGDLIMADASEDYDGIGKSVEIKGIGNRKVISGLHTFLLRDKRGVFVNGYKGYIQSSRFVKKQLDKLATGLKVYGVSKTNLKVIEIPLPPKNEQTRIATILSGMDTEIAALGTKLAKYQHIKQGMMQNLLTGKIRLI